MAGQTYYKFLGVDGSAESGEIEGAIDQQYQQWRRLVTHHDPNKVNEANQVLQRLEEIRATLLDPGKRVSYDVSIGLGGATGGLFDPSAVSTSPRPLTPPPPRPATPTQMTSQRTDAWVCSKCQTANTIGTHFCKTCGRELSRQCPNCHQQVEVTAPFCPSCGANIEEALRAREVAEQQRVIEQANRRREKAEREALLGPVRKASEQAWNLARVGCFLFFLSFIPFVGFISMGLWGAAIWKSRQVLAISQVPGDTEYRATAKKAFGWSVVPLGLLAVSSMILVLFFMVVAISNSVSQ